MANQFLRQYTLSLGNTQEVIYLTGIRVTFEIIKDMHGFPNLGKFTLWNLSKTTRAKIQDEFTEVTFNVGYGSALSLLFSGQIKNVTHIVDGPDNQVVMYAADGQQSFEQSYTNFALAKGAKIQDIITKVVKDFDGLELNNIIGVNNDGDKLLGVSLSGPTPEILNELAREYNFNWSIQNGQVDIIGSDAFIDLDVDINAATGMINSPALTEIGADVTVLLNPSLIPGRTFTISSLGADVSIGNLFFREIVPTEVEGRYKILKVTHTGDTHLDMWYSIAVGKTL